MIFGLGVWRKKGMRLKFGEKSFFKLEFAARIDAFFTFLSKSEIFRHFKTKKFLHLRVFIFEFFRLNWMVQNEMY